MQQNRNHKTHFMISITPTYFGIGVPSSESLRTKESQVLDLWVYEHKGSKVGLWSFVFADSLEMEVRCQNKQGLHLSWMSFY